MSTHLEKSNKKTKKQSKSVGGNPRWWLFFKTEIPLDSTTIEKKKKSDKPKSKKSTKAEKPRLDISGPSNFMYSLLSLFATTVYHGDLVWLLMLVMMVSLVLK